MALANENRTSQVLEAMNYYFGIEHCRSVTLVDDVASSLNGEWFELNGIDEEFNAKNYYVLLSDGTAIDPAPAGRTKIEIVYTANDDAATIASLFTAAFAAIEEFSLIIADEKVTIINKFLGDIVVEDQSAAPSLTFAIDVLGFGGSLGAVAQGGSTLTTEESVQPITSDQTGDVVLDEISKGFTITLEMTLAEMTEDRWKDLIGNVSGDIYDAGGGNELVGFGTSKLYNSKFDFSGKLVAHPIRLPLSDRSADIVINKTAPRMDEINFSGQDVQGANFSFVAYKDSSKPDAINLMSRGDYTLV